MFAYIQKLGKALLLPVAVLPICAILMGIGYALCPGAMIADVAIEAPLEFIGLFMVKAGGALIDNMALLFAIGVAVGMAKKNDGTAALAAIVSWLMITVLLSPKTIALFTFISVDEVGALAFAKIQNPFIGILCGLIGAGCYNKFKDVQLPEFLAFFSGKRCVAIVCGLISMGVAAILLFVWPIVFSGLYAFGNWIKGLGGIGVGIYAFANRLLIPTGLHHALNNVFWFDTVGIGDLTHFWAGDTSNTPGVNWSLGMYMSGFFPCMMFGIPGAALAFVLCSKNKKATAGIVGATAFCAFLCGVTEPFEFMFMFLAFPLYILYSLLYGVFGIITYYVGFRAGFSFSAGCVDLILSSQLPAAANTWMIIPLGIGAFVAFFLVFYFYLKAFKVDIPGSEGLKEALTPGESGDSKGGSRNEKFAKIAEGVLAAVGGKENITDTDYCVTRLRLTLKDGSLVDDAAIKAAGASGVIKPTKNTCQVVIGTQVEFVYNEFVKLVE